MLSEAFLKFPGSFLSSLLHVSRLRPSKKKHVSRPDFYKKRERAGGFFCYLLFPIACFLYTLSPSPRDTLELRYWLNTSLFNFDTHKGLTVKIYIILVCTQQLWAFCWSLLIKTLLIKNNKKREAALKNEAGGDEKHVFFFFTWPNMINFGEIYKCRFARGQTRNPSTATPQVDILFTASPH